ncbi:MAG: RNB domain-containing ribonuclease, partial [Leptospiraceae bacterium]|nr:RNB domain-containing ribonuclease [Leptospiraceae bacterium]
MSLTSQILYLLQAKAGQRYKTRDLMKQLQQAASQKTKKSFKPDRHGRRSSRRPSQGTAVHREEVDEVLSALAHLGLITFSSKGFAVRDPFEVRGRVSLNPRGNAFISVRGADAESRDVFVASENARSVLPGDEVLLLLRDRKQERFEGRILKVLKRGRARYRLRLLHHPHGDFVIGILLDSSIALQARVDISRLPADQRPGLKTDVVIVVTLSGKDVRYRGAWFKEAEFVRFESDSDLDADFSRILMKHNLDAVYPAHIPLPLKTDQPGPHNVYDWNLREDCRSLLTITIDGADAKDFDDALSLAPGLSSNTRRLYVHIADVSHYVKKDSLLDQEALHRSTSVYLAGRVVPMLPPVLSEHLCSLVSGVDRLAFTAEMEFDIGSGKIVKSKFYKSIIQVDHRLTYGGAEAMLASNDDSAQARLVRELYQAALIWRKERMQSGRVDLELPEVDIKVDPDNRDRIQSYGYRERLQSSILIEECMLTANTCVAAFIRKKKAPVLYRVHEPIPPERIEKLNFFMESYGVPWQFQDLNYGSIRGALQQIHLHPNQKTLSRVFSMQLLRSFMQAVYTPEADGHWGLGFRDYCHFTSPIRRYP